ncbi:metal-dependent phosphohydrolase HD sub domain p rotein [Mycolicibacterium canariasense]|uniref:Metal-dependent phosphohydrolase HD sub domain p rotein n=1 Tax=Mycolicibacterium canariasense TaxID=228230 RepID=A0A100WFT8_MYCCR|nr:HD domain-containing protein [Mycolicibacterium canariasense]MCV7210740.1 HD domain-containing protein [Mycolicibacterium canariasense]ORU98331.1 phosphohydrolase [Mycolicibacterium canariasense]GAS97491.1 metal-dependent phosphohydrolase HD sub domain p rotein [Mycolicibacterium canariasense]
MTTPDDALTARFGLPDSPTAAAARQLTYDVSPEFIYNHAVRSYLFARELSALEESSDHDDELLFLTCVLHDLGATEYANTGQRFEVDGADAAAKFLDDHGVDAAAIDTAWTAIALHTSVGLAHRFGPIAALAQLGIGTDIVGTHRHQLPAGFADRVHAAWPRHDLGYALASVLAEQAHRNPAKAPPMSFPAHLHELMYPAQSSLTWPDLVEAAGWNDHPVAVSESQS